MDEKSVIRNFRITAKDGKTYDTKHLTMEDWAEQFDGVLKLSRKEILQNSGKISAEIAKKHAETEFEKYRIIQDRLFKSDFDKFIEIENNLKKKKQN